MHTPDYTIRLERPEDYRAVEELTREAFWNVYKPGCDEHYFTHTMRSHEDFIPELAFVLEKDGEIIANVMYTRAWLTGEDGKEKTIVSFGPLGVHPKYQRKGYGKALLEYSFERAAELGYDATVIFGSPCNYAARGMVSCKKMNVSLEGGVYPCALLVKELVPGALEGKPWVYRASTAADCCEDVKAVAAFDAQFPPKEKGWSPTQEEFYIYSRSVVVR